MGNPPVIFHFTFLKMTRQQNHSFVMPFLARNYEHADTIEVVEGKKENGVENVFYYEKCQPQVQVQLVLCEVAAIERS
jgi:hypothetical protein